MKQRSRFPWLSSLALASLLACLAAPAALAQIDFDQVMGLDVKPRKSDNHAWDPAGTRLAFLWDPGDGSRLEVAHAAGGRLESWIRAGIEGAPASLDDFVWSPDGRRLVLVGDGDLFLWEIGTRTLSRLTATEATEEDPKFSPDGRSLAFVRDQDLVLADLAAGTEKALTQDGKDGEIYNGKTDWVYWEELWGRDSTGYWWSPDGTAIAYYRFEEEGVGRYPLVDHSSVYPKIRWQPYPKAGTTNPKVRVGVMSLATGATNWLETGDPAEWYLPRVHWKPAGGLALERLNRDQTRLELIDCDPASGACKPVLAEEASTFVRVGDETRFLADNRFIWASDRTGWRHLYLYDAEGNLIRPLTGGAGAVRGVGGAPAPRGWLVVDRFGGGELAAKDRQVVRVRLDGSGSEELSQGTGWHGAKLAPASGYWLHTWSDSEHAERQVVRNGDGISVVELPSSAGAALTALPAWEYFTIPGPEGSQLPARLLRPAGLDPSRRYPVVMYHYGGPDSQVVVNRWDNRRRDLWHKWMAQRGYGILMVDNRMSTFFGKTGADLVHRRFGPNNLAAQLAAVAYLRTLPWVDAERIGLWGWSGGGSNTLYALFNSPGTWAAGVSGAPVTDWHLYDSIWTERYLDHPEDNEEGYVASSPITYAKQLADPLLVVHGTGDDNVHPQNTLVLLKALVDAGLPVVDAIYPNQKHGFKDPENNHFYRRMTEFFDRHLKP